MILTYDTVLITHMFVDAIYFAREKSQSLGIRPRVTKVHQMYLGEHYSPSSLDPPKKILFARMCPLVFSIIKNISGTQVECWYREDLREGYEATVKQQDKSLYS